MFTGRKILLSSLAENGGLGIQVIRDCSFAFIGKVPSTVEPRLVPCSKPEHIREAIAASGIAGIITTPTLAENVPVYMGLALSDTPVQSAYSVHEVLCEEQTFHWETFPSQIASSAKIHPSAVVAENDVVIGDNCVIHPNAVLYPRTILGEGTSIGAGTVVGCDGFEVDTSVIPHRILPQAGGVRIGKNVDIQAKCTIVRATFGGFTEIGDESKFDCQVHLAHDCSVGKRVRITACSEISGRVIIEDSAYLGPNVSISNGIRIGERAAVTIGAVVTRDVPADARVSGNFAVDHAKWINLMRKVR